MRRPRKPRRFVRKEDPHKTNEKITAREVRLVGDGMEPSVVPIRKALEIAEEQGLDLVEISPKADPPVCKILDYKKFLYEQKKKQKELKAKASKVTVKEIRFGPNTDDHDFNFKLKHAREFLESGDKVRAFVFFRGRTIVYRDKGELLLLRLANELEDIAKVEMLPKMEGKKMFIILAPQKGKK